MRNITNPKIKSGSQEDFLLRLTAKCGEITILRATEEFNAFYNVSLETTCINVIYRRLETKTLVKTRWSELEHKRGGRRKLIISVTDAGLLAIKAVDIEVDRFRKIYESTRDEK